MRAQDNPREMNGPGAGRAVVSHWWAELRVETIRPPTSRDIYKALERHTLHCWIRVWGPATSVRLLGSSPPGDSNWRWSW